MKHSNPSTALPWSYDCPSSNKGLWIWITYAMICQFTWVTSKQPFCPYVCQCPVPVHTSGWKKMWPLCYLGLWERRNINSEEGTPAQPIYSLGFPGCCICGWDNEMRLGLEVLTFNLDILAAWWKCDTFESGSREMNSFYCLEIWRMRLNCSGRVEILTQSQSKPTKVTFCLVILLKWLAYLNVTPAHWV